MFAELSHLLPLAQHRHERRHRQIATPTTTTAPATTAPTSTTTPSTVAGTYTVQFQGPLSGPCNGWPLGTGTMAIGTDADAVSITLTYPSGYQVAYRGSYHASSGAFNTPDVKYGRNPLTGTFVLSNGAFEVHDGREHTQNIEGTECIGGFTARHQ